MPEQLVDGIKLIPIATRSRARIGDGRARTSTKNNAKEVDTRTIEYGWWNR